MAIYDTGDRVAEVRLDPPPLKWSALRYGFEPWRTDNMAKRHKPEEIITKLRQVDVLVSYGFRRMDEL